MVTSSIASAIHANALAHNNNAYSRPVPSLYPASFPLKTSCLPRKNSCISKRSRSSLLVTAAVKVAGAKNVVCCKTLVAKPENIEAVKTLCKKAVDFSVKQMQDRNNGILQFECSQDQWDSNVFYTWERYESNTTMGRHNMSKEMKFFMLKVNDLLEKPVGMALYEWRNGMLGPACVQGGPKGEGGLDDATGAGGKGGASYRQTSPFMALAHADFDEAEARAKERQTNADAHANADANGMEVQEGLAEEAGLGDAWGKFWGNLPFGASKGSKR